MILKTIFKNPSKIKTYTSNFTKSITFPNNSFIKDKYILLDPNKHILLFLDEIKAYIVEFPYLSPYDKMKDTKSNTRILYKVLFENEIIFLDKDDLCLVK